MRRRLQRKSTVFFFTFLVELTINYRILNQRCLLHCMLVLIFKVHSNGEVVVSRKTNKIYKKKSIKFDIFFFLGNIIILDSNRTGELFIWLML